MSLGRGLAGLVPVLGPLLAEIVSETIPSQRFERIESFARELSVRLEALGDEQKRIIEKSEERIDLVEDGFRTAAKFRSGERRRAVVEIVLKGISGDEQAAVNGKRILDLLSQLDDEEIIQLINLVKINYINYDEFYAKHKPLLEPLHATIHSAAPIRRRAALREAALIKLERLGLTKEDLIAKTGGVRGTSNQMIQQETRKIVTELGRLVLYEAGLLTDTEYEGA